MEVRLYSGENEYRCQYDCKSAFLSLSRSELWRPVGSLMDMMKATDDSRVILYQFC